MQIGEKESIVMTAEGSLIVSTLQEIPLFLGYVDFPIESIRGTVTLAAIPNRSELGHCGGISWVEEGAGLLRTLPIHPIGFVPDLSRLRYSITGNNWE